MRLIDIIRERRSVRAYKDQPVPEDALARILEAARLAPSARNRQQWKFVVVRDPEKRRKLAEAAGSQEFVAEAPVLIVAVALDPERVMTCGLPTYTVDLSIALTHIILAAWDEGLGTCWTGSFRPEGVKRVLGIPDKYKVVTVMPLGYAADSPQPKERKPLEEIVCYEEFSE